jgi:hypothetical protein
MRQLEYIPRLEPVIKTTIKKVFIQPWTFGDTEARTRSKVALPQWGDLFNMINRYKYIKYIPENDLDVRELDN